VMVVRDHCDAEALRSGSGGSEERTYASCES
jgi:hypothetical protein